MAAGAFTQVGRHPVAVLVERLHAQLDQLALAGVWGLSGAELSTVLPDLTRLSARTNELELRVAATAYDRSVQDGVGASSTAGWWANETRQTKPLAHRRVRLARALEHDHEPVRDAMAYGEVLLEQAEVIVAAIDALPVDLVDPAVRRAAELRLIVFAREHDAKALRILGRRILEIVAPDVAEAHEQRILEKEEAQARAAARFTMSDDGHGKCHGRFTISSLAGEILRKHLTALAAPRHQHATGQEVPAQPRPSAERMGQAFTEYIERYPVDRTPHAGGVAATIVVTMTLEALLGAERAATLDTGGVISASEARRLACEAGIIPAVLGGKSQVLDLGRKARFHTEPMRIALGIEQGGCTTQGCDWPPGMCHTHHDIGWHKGGPTDKKHGRLLCPHHHARAHDPKYEMTKLPGNKVAFTRRC